jgi:hypothetical protein
MPGSAAQTTGIAFTARAAVAANDEVLAAGQDGA